MAEARPGAVIGGRYALTRALGAGGFGQVWQAHDPVLGVDVAVKQVRLDGPLPEEARAELLARAAREARHAARLRDHAHIVTVYDVVEVDEGASKVPWIVMQWVDGRSLADELKDGGPLDPSRAAAVASALLSALDAAHRAGVVHRDVKPANVLLGADGSVLLADFGIALALTDPRLTRTTLVIGSPGYMAPERWQGAGSDGRADLFSLGVTLYEAVEGVLPFRADNPTAALTEEPRPMERAGGLEPLIRGLLEKDPAARPTVEAARELLAAEAATVRRPPVRRPTVRETRPMDPGPRKPVRRPDGAVTLTRSRGDLVTEYGVYVGTVGMRWCAGLGAFLGAVTVGDPVLEIGSLEIGDDRWYFNGLLGLGVLAILGGFACWLVGLGIGARAKSDTITVDAHGLTVTGWRQNEVRGGTATGGLKPPAPSSFTIRWDALERIAVENRGSSLLSASAVAAWFRPGDEPSTAWRTKHDVEPREGGGLWVYSPDRDRPTTIDGERLRDALRRFAPELYDDPDDVPDP